MGKDSKTSQKNDESVQINDDNDFDNIMEKSEKLKESYYERRTEYNSSDDLPHLEPGTWITGTSDGEIIDIEINEHDDIVLTTRIADNGNIRKVNVRNRNDIYSDQNELVRLLEFMDIKEGNIPELLGETIPLKITRYALPSNELRINTWKPYIPKKFDKIGILKYKIDYFMRFLGYEGEFQNKIVSISFIIITLFWWLTFISIITSGFTELSSLSSPYNILIFVSGILSIIMTIYTPLIMRTLRVLQEKYRQSKREDTVVKE